MGMSIDSARNLLEDYDQLATMAATRANELAELRNLGRRTSFDDNDIVFENDMVYATYYRRGESNTMSFPFEYVFDDAWKTLEKEKIDMMNRLQEERNNATIAEQDAEHEQRERELYNCLRRKFEGED